MANTCGMIQQLSQIIACERNIGLEGPLGPFAVSSTGIHVQNLSGWVIRGLFPVHRLRFFRRPILKAISQDARIHRVPIDFISDLHNVLWSNRRVYKVEGLLRKDSRFHLHLQTRSTVEQITQLILMVNYSNMKNFH